MRRAVVEPWRRGGPLELGDREWDPRDSRLRVLEGAELAPSELAHGQGWHSAERSGRDVTERLLGPSPSDHIRDRAVVAVLAGTGAEQRAAAELLERLALRPVEWTVVRTRILGAAMNAPADAGVAAAVLLVEQTGPTGRWLFDAGIALGTLGAGAIVAQLGTGTLPVELQDLNVLRLEPERAESLHPLAERLRAAGCAVGLEW